jgi:alkylation response protein AidB-like acyl-CoA dehydrogenase
MDLSLSESEARFLGEVEAFLDRRLKPEWRGVADSDARPNRAVSIAWQAELAARGWLVPAWPEEHGGCNWTAMQLHLFRTALARARAPRLIPMAFSMVGPLICAYGTDAQKAFYLPRIITSEDLWCQGFSEPGAGSDLAALTTTARRDGAVYRVDGRKIWTSYAHLATRMFALVRTDKEAARRQDGISMLLIDMTLPGISVRPIRTIDGAHHFNEVLFDDVAVPVTCLLGPEHGGWGCARFLLSHERTGMADIAATRTMLDRVAGCGGTDDEFGRRLAALDIRSDAVEMLELRSMAADSFGVAGAIVPSLLKIAGTELRQATLQLGVEALGLDGIVAQGGGPEAHLVHDALFYRAASIYGGTNEIQRNQIARAVLRSGGGV